MKEKSTKIMRQMMILKPLKSCNGSLALLDREIVVLFVSKGFRNFKLIALVLNNRFRAHHSNWRCCFFLVKNGWSRQNWKKC